MTLVWLFDRLAGALHRSIAQSDLHAALRLMMSSYAYQAVRAWLRRSVSRVESTRDRDFSLHLHDIHGGDAGFHRAASLTGFSVDRIAPGRGAGRRSLIAS